MRYLAVTGNLYFGFFLCELSELGVRNSSEYVLTPGNKGKRKREKNLR